MSQVYKADGTVVPVTLVSAGPCFITQIKKKDKDGYLALQVGFQEKKKITKPLKGHLKGLSNFKYLNEFRLDEKDQAELERGQKITVNVFQPGEKVKATGISKGKGFLGIVKRYGFSGAPHSHGTKDQSRHSGSVGAKGPARTFKGTKMGGRTGGEQVSVKNLEIMEIDEKNNILKIKGAIPGTRDSLIRISAPGEMKFASEEIKKSSSAEASEDKEKEIKEIEPEITVSAQENSSNKE